MTEAGVRLFTAGSAIFGALWGLFTVGTPFGVVAGALLAGVFGYFMWGSMRMRELP